MEVIKNKNRTRLIQAALGKIPCDLSLENAVIVNTLTGIRYQGHIDILDGIIVRIRKIDQAAEIPAAQIINCEYNLVIPGWIDTHMHIESTMMIPENFGRAAVVWGTTTAATDPHEIANVCGIMGIDYMRESARKSPLRIYTLAPSCVPAVPAVESAGATFKADTIRALLKNDDVIGVAEIMDYAGVINDDERMHTIVDAGKEANGFLQGHAPFVRGNELCAYLLGGPVSDHETRDPDEMIEKLNNGMHINLKSSSLSDTIELLAQRIYEYVPYKDLISLCTDDVHAADLLKTGHINHVANECLINSPLTATDIIRFGTINAARELGLTDIGAIAPGYVADLQIISIHQFSVFENPPQDVFVAGKHVAHNGKLIEEIKNEPTHFYYHTVDLQHITSPDDFLIYGNTNNKQLIFSAARANMKPNQPLVYEKLPFIDGHVDLTNYPQYQYLAIVNRYGSRGITKVVCSDFNLKYGCIASTISHDSHNMTIVYKDPNDAYVAARELERVGGGMCFVENGKVVYTLELPVGGLMSYLPAEELAPQIQRMNEYVSYATDGDNSMLLAIAILALPVRPGIIITDKGVIRGETLQFIPLTKSI